VKSRCAILLTATALRLSAESSLGELNQAVDRQDRAAAERVVARLQEAAAKAPESASARYHHALASSQLSQIMMELGDRAGSSAAARAGVDSAKRAVALKPDSAEHHRILGALCGQAIPGNPLNALKYGACARDEVNKAVELDGRSYLAWLSRGVGNYYMPAAFGGGADKAILDFKKAIELNPKSADAHLWMGIALRKLGRNAEARAALEKSQTLNPDRLWARQQLEKTPAK
jgi:tetratricopeptide (TPR) repeat protein